MVQPIQRVIRAHSEAGEARTVLLLAAILTAAALAHPRLCRPALGALTRSTAHAAQLAAPLLAVWPWGALAPTELWEVCAR